MKDIRKIMGLVAIEGLFSEQTIAIDEPSIPINLSQH